MSADIDKTIYNMYVMKKKYIDIFIFTIVALLFYLYERGDIYQSAMGTMIGLEMPFRNYIVISLCLILIIYIIINLRFLRGIRRLPKVYLLFSATSISLSFIISLIIPFGSRVLYLTLLLPLFLFLFFIIIGKKIGSNNWIIIIYFLVLCGLLIGYVETFTLKMTIINEEEMVSNASYYALYFLPLVLCNKKKLINIISIIIVSIAVISSAKRGGFIALSVALITYFYVYLFKVTRTNRYRLNNKRGRFALIVLFLGVSLYIIREIAINSDLLIASRILNISETGGSGRIDVWRESLHLIYDSSFIGLLFGHGWQSVALYSPLGLTAHNDIIEVFYDFGCIAFCLYIWLLSSLIRFAKRLIKEQSLFAASFAASCCILIINSMVSHIIIYPSFLMIFSIFWGYIIGSEMRINHYCTRVR